MPKVNGIYLTALNLTAQNIPLKITEYAFHSNGICQKLTEYT